LKKIAQSALGFGCRSYICDRRSAVLGYEGAAVGRVRGSTTSGDHGCAPVGRPRVCHYIMRSRVCHSRATTGVLLSGDHEGATTSCDHGCAIVGRPRGSPLLMVFFTGQTFEALDAIDLGEYELCRFEDGALSRADLSNFEFSECTFVNCDLSMATLHRTSFHRVAFVNCKLMGLHFESCNTFSLEMEFEGCNLDFSSFFRLKLPGTKFKNCKMESVDFSESDFSKAVFDECTLSNAQFDQTRLERADFRTAHDFSIDPAQNMVAKAQFSKHNVAGLLRKYGVVIVD